METDKGAIKGVLESSERSVQLVDTHRPARAPTRGAGDDACWPHGWPARREAGMGLARTRGSLAG